MGNSVKSSGNPQFADIEREAGRLAVEGSVDVSNLKRIKMKIGRVLVQLIEECTLAEPTVPGSVAAGQDVKKIVDRAFELIDPDPFGVALDKIARRHGTTMPNKMASEYLRTVCELLDEARS